MSICLFDGTDRSHLRYGRIRIRPPAGFLILGNTKRNGPHADDCFGQEESIAYWRKELPHADETELEMMYTHLSNGLMHVVVEGYDKYSKEEMIHFVNRVVKSQSFCCFNRPESPLKLNTAPLCPNGIIKAYKTVKMVKKMSR